VDRLLVEAGVFKPAARATMEDLNLVRLFLLKAGAKQVDEQVVIAIPAALPIEGDDEEIGLIQLLELTLGIARRRGRAPGRRRRRSIIRAHLEQGAAGPPARQWQRRIGAGREEQVQSWREVINENVSPW